MSLKSSFEDMHIEMEILTKQLKLLEMLIRGTVVEPNISTCGADHKFITVGQEYGICYPGFEASLLTGRVALIISNGVIFLYIV